MINQVKDYLKPLRGQMRKLALELITWACWMAIGVLLTLWAIEKGCNEKGFISVFGSGYSCGKRSVNYGYEVK